MKNLIKYLLCSIIMTLAMGTLSFAASVDLVDLAVESNKNVRQIEIERERENILKIQQQQIKEDEKRSKAKLEEMVMISKKEDTVKKDKAPVKVEAVSSPVTVTNEDMKMVKYIMRRNPSVSQQNARYIVNAVTKYSNQFGVDKYIVYAMIQRESNFTPICVTGQTHGLMQIHENTAPYLGISMSNIYDIDSNIKAGVKYIGGNIKRYKDLTTAISAYAYGPAPIKSGNYSTKYANMVYTTKNQILSSIR